MIGVRLMNTNKLWIARTTVIGCLVIAIISLIGLENGGVAMTEYSRYHEAGGNSSVNDKHVADKQNKQGITSLEPPIELQSNNLLTNVELKDTETKTQKNESILTNVSNTLEKQIPQINENWNNQRNITRKSLMTTNDSIPKQSVTKFPDVLTIKHPLRIQQFDNFSKIGMIEQGTSGFDLVTTRFADITTTVSTKTTTLKTQIPHHWNPDQFKGLPAKIKLKLWSNNSETGEVELIFDDNYGLYTYNGKPIMWTFWDYNAMPPYIKLNIETLRCHNAPHIYVATIDDAFFKTNLKAELPWFFDLLIPAHKADVIRCTLLLRFGGMWVDADTLGLASMYPRFRLLTQGYDMFNYDWKPEGSPIGVGMIGPVKVNSLLLQEWKTKSSAIFSNKSNDFIKFEQDKMNTSMKQKFRTKYPIKWAELLSSILNPSMRRLLAENKMKYTAIDGPTTWGQFDRHSMNKHLFKNNQSEWGNLIKINETELLLMHNAYVGGKDRRMSIPEYLGNKSLISRLQIASLTKCLKQHIGKFMEISKFRISETGNENELEYRIKVRTVQNNRSIAFWPNSLPREQFGNLQHLLDSFGQDKWQHLIPLKN